MSRDLRDILSNTKDGYAFFLEIMEIAQFK